MQARRSDLTTQAPAGMRIASSPLASVCLHSWRSLNRRACHCERTQMANPTVSLLSAAEIQSIHEASLVVLRDTGILVHDPQTVELLRAAGARVEAAHPIVHLSESLVMQSLVQAGKRYILHGRNAQRVARFGFGDLVLLSSPGQKAWLDPKTQTLRLGTMQDARDAIRLGDALPHISFVGAISQPEEVSERYREVVLTAELVRGTTKPTMAWTHTGAAARHVLEIYRTLAGGEKALRERPMTEAFLEPISPLQLPKDGLEMIREFVKAGQPVSVGPMAMTSGTAPATLAGTLAQENAEILAGVVVTQLLGPGTPMKYGGIPHILDPRTSICSFGSPEQGLMAVAMVQMGRFYGFPVYVNTNLTDAKLLDVQAGTEKAATLLLAALAGADMFGHAGICGADHAGSLAWLMADNEVMAYVKRVAAGVRGDAGVAGHRPDPKGGACGQLPRRRPHRSEFSQGTLAARTGLDPAGVWRLEKGRTRLHGRPY